MARVLILEAVVLSKLYSEIIGLFISLFLLWWLRKKNTQLNPICFFNAVMSDSAFLFGTNHHLAENSVFGQERFSSRLKCD